MARTKLADQAGKGNGTGARGSGDSLMRNLGGTFNKQATSDVSIHIVQDDVTLIGEFMASASGGGCYVVVLSGSGESASGYRVDKLLKGFKSLGHNSLSVDYRGYGVSSGSTTKQGFYTDARAMVSYLHRCRSVPLSNIVIHGWSIGSAPAVETTLACQQAGLTIKGLILQCPISTTSGAAQAHGFSAIQGAIGNALMGKMNNFSKISQLHIKILILKGSADLPGFKTMADALYSQTLNATLITFKGGHVDHDQIFHGRSGGMISQFLA